MYSPKLAFCFSVTRVRAIADFEPYLFPTKRTVKERTLWSHYGTMDIVGIVTALENEVGMFPCSEETVRLSARQSTSCEWTYYCNRVCCVVLHVFFLCDQRPCVVGSMTLRTRAATESISTASKLSVAGVE